MTLTTWNYRIVKEHNYLYVREVFYNEKNEICAISENPSIGATNQDCLKNKFEKAMLSFNEPIVDIDDPNFKWGKIDGPSSQMNDDKDVVCSSLV